MASFRAGNFDFVLIAAHIRWGDNDAARTAELQLMADWVDAKHKEKNCEDKDIVVMGDFNIPSREDPMFKAITSKGLVIPEALVGLQFGTNLAKDKRYDQILIYPQYPQIFSKVGGAVDFYAGDHKALFPSLDLQAFTFQLSDHLPLWMQVQTDLDGFKLDEIIKG